MTEKIIVLGAGMVGVSTALALQKRGQHVTLIDRKPPANETSYGNAGVIAVGSSLPLNNPDLFADIPSLLRNRNMGFRYSPGYVLAQWYPMLCFLWSGRERNTPHRIKALHQLLNLSSGLHKSWLGEAGKTNHLRENGWMKLYRNEDQYQHSARLCQAMDDYLVKYNVLDNTEIAEVEPDLAPVFHKGLLIHDASSVDNPSAVANVYLELFTGSGGRFIQREIKKASQSDDWLWHLAGDDGVDLECSQLVIALGPWSRDFVAKLEINLPMIFERGGHRQFLPLDDKRINRPIYDAGGGYVITPMSEGIRLTCGVELNDRDAQYKSIQLDHSEKIARETFPIGERTGDDWNGSRPTLPDSVPAIGPCKLRGLWLNTGHQHIGFSTGPGSGELLAAQMLGEEPAINYAAFLPSRFRV